MGEKSGKRCRESGLTTEPFVVTLLNPYPANVVNMVSFQ